MTIQDETSQVLIRGAEHGPPACKGTWYSSFSIWKSCACIHIPCGQAIPSLIKRASLVVPIDMALADANDTLGISLVLQFPLTTQAISYQLSYVQFPTVYLGHSIFAFPKDPQIPVIKRNDSYYHVDLLTCNYHGHLYLCPWGAIAPTSVNLSQQTLFTAVGSRDTYLSAPALNYICVASSHNGYTYGINKCITTEWNYCLNISCKFCIDQICVMPLSFDTNVNITMFSQASLWWNNFDHFHNVSLIHDLLGQIMELTQSPKLLHQLASLQWSLSQFHEGLIHTRDELIAQTQNTGLLSLPKGSIPTLWLVVFILSALILLLFIWICCLTCKLHTLRTAMFMARPVTPVYTPLSVLYQA
nr:PREDICTED: uncharacterized protein LOC106705864 [Latimeria chalumnae]|eukprot:XP_014351403.1 PREDICTED: uncharacterized protein LOC106705864 [Latimeria chalumnae]